MGQRGTIAIVGACVGAVVQVLVQNGVLTVEVGNVITTLVGGIVGALILAWTARKPGA